MKRVLQILIPLVVIAVGGAGAATLIKMRRPPKKRPPKVLPPLVRTVEVRAESLGLTVEAHATVEPRAESTLAAQVAGRIIEISNSFKQGAAFERGDVLLRLDPTDYELAVARAEAQVAQAEMALAREEAEARLAREEWEDYGEGEPDPLVLREPQLAEARARLKSAQAAHRQAEINLERTKITAPYAGRVRRKQVDLGQFVSAGTPLGRIYPVDYVEIPLPVPLDELRHLKFPLVGVDGRRTEVRVRAALGGREREWSGRVVRTGPEIDRKTRMLELVVRVDDPYESNPPLIVGQFVDAEIQGRTVADLFVVPREALRKEDRVLVVDEEDRLRFREVEILRVEGDRVLVKSGLDAGERVLMSPLQIVTDGMKVRVHEEGNEETK